ncbi:Nanog protein [Oryzias latipes]|uniref:Nanog n=1 Tax=Oryzias latipes TaxID=8090 RepID=B7U5S3_ORYLA|nr:homeobox protein NANOG [Oryzias latipes]ACJ51123.1 Nanog [Oryzias latipes]
MAEWKTQVNYNPTFHAYTYGFVYQTGPEQNHVTGNDWSQNCEQNGYNGGPTQSHFPARSREESPPRSPEQQPESGHYYQDSGVVYIREAQTGRLVMAGQHRVGLDSGENCTRRTGSDSASDSEAHTSPDSWSSCSNYDRSVPQTDPVVWVKNEEQTGARSPDHSEDVSSSLMVESQSFAVQDTGDASSSTHAPFTTTKKQASSTPNAPKAKVRAAFSESQMSTLVQRFSVQRYLAPAEMKNLADVTGLTYKQVKTWFQNRRMKLRRHQKDTSWVSERYTINKDNTAADTVFSNVAPHVPPYQGDGMSHLRHHYNQHMMGAAFKNTPHNLAFYLAAMGNPPGTAGYPPWSSSPPQAAVPSRPQVPGWPLPPGRSQFGFCPIPYDPSDAASLNNFERNAIPDSKDGESAGGANAAILHNAVQ